MMLYRLIFKVHDSELHSTRVFTSEYRDVIFEMARALDDGTACKEVLGNPGEYASVSDIHLYKLIEGDYIEVSRDTWASDTHTTKDGTFYMVCWESLTATVKHRQRAFTDWFEAKKFANGLYLMYKQPNDWAVEGVKGVVLSDITMVNVKDGHAVEVSKTCWRIEFPDILTAAYSCTSARPIKKEQKDD